MIGSRPAKGYRRSATQRSALRLRSERCPANHRGHHPMPHHTSPLSFRLTGGLSHQRRAAPRRSAPRRAAHHRGPGFRPHHLPTRNMAFRRFELTIEGTRPLILSNPCTVDPLGPHAAAIKYFTGLKKNRNEHALRRLHWLFSGYWGTEGTFAYGPSLDGDSAFDGFAEPFLPAQNLQRCIRDGATAWKLGKDTKRAIVVEGDAPLAYDGPTDAQLMYEDSRFVSIAPTGRGTMAVRVRIPHWSANYSMLVNDEIIDPQTLAKILDRAGIAEGLGTWRPMHGRFQVTQLDEVEVG